MLILRGAKLLKISHATKCLWKYFVQHFLIYFVWTSYCLFKPGLMPDIGLLTCANNYLL